MHIKQVGLGEQLIQYPDLRWRQNVKCQNWCPLKRTVIHTKNLEPKAFAEPCLATKKFHTKQLIIAHATKPSSRCGSAFGAIV